MDVLYFCLALLSLACVASALFRVLRLGYGVPLYFLTGWLCGELALWHLISQLVFTLLLASAGVLESGWGQAGLGIYCIAWLGLLRLHCQAADSAEHLGAALVRGLGPEYRDQMPAARRQLLTETVVTRSWMRPFHFRRDGVERLANLSYGDAGKRNLLDIYRPTVLRPGGSPVLLQIHGGAWMIGEKEQQGKPLMYHMAQRGWLCVAINYRLSPKHAFPAHIIDVKRAIAWVKDNIAEYGGDPDFIALTGGSAGGHLTALAALTPNLPQWQEGFEQADTSVQAAVPFYGVYDFLDRHGVRGSLTLDKVIGDKVMQSDKYDEHEAWDVASPIAHVGPHAPPMCIVQGSHDNLVWAEEARLFAAHLEAASEQPVVYAELPGAQHAFEIFHSIRTDHAVNAVAAFLEWAHARHEAG